MRTTPRPRVPAPSTAAAEDRAEEVRAWFVQVRGGSPFLSGPDALALCAWLDAGVPVPRIIRAVEAAAAHRRARRLRAPFTLKSCARWLDAPPSAVRYQAPTAPIPTFVADSAGPAPTVGARLPGPAPVGLSDATVTTLVARFEAALVELSAARTTPERLRVACAFHEAAWAAAEADRDALLAAVADELADVRELMDDDGFARVCEEAARHALRSAFPACSVEALTAGEGDDGLD